MANTSWKTIAADIVRLIECGELSVGARVPSGDELAATWEVSRHTAHHAIEELQRQGIVIRQRRWGTVVADRGTVKTGRAGFLVDQFAPAYNFPSGDLIRGMQDTLGEDIQLIIAESKGDSDLEVRQLRKFQDQVDGLILYPTSHPRSRPAIQRLVDAGFPTVVLDRLPDGVRADAVMSDNEGATISAIRALEAHGHRRIAFFSFHKPDFSTVAERHSAYRSALSEVGVEDVTELTRWFPRELDGNPQGFVQAIYDSLFTLLYQKEPITALFCVQDSFAAAALQAFDRMGVSVPGDLELATFNDWPPMMLRAPWCTHRIVQRSYDIGASAAEILLDRLNGNRDDQRIVRVHADFFVAEGGQRPAMSALLSNSSTRSEDFLTNGG
jgi:DNA-binding LacI/PurR family transcriptional regulator